MRLSTGHPEFDRVRLQSPWFSKDLMVNDTGKLVSETVTLPPGVSVIRLKHQATAAQGAGTSGDSRFKISNFRATQVN
jgi:hypothetical protein